MSGEGVTKSCFVVNFAFVAYHSNAVDAFSKIPDLLRAKEGWILVKLVTVDDRLPLVLADGRLADLKKTPVQLGRELVKGGRLEIWGYRMLKRNVKSNLHVYIKKNITEKDKMILIYIAVSV